MTFIDSYVLSRSNILVNRQQVLRELIVFNRFQLRRPESATSRGNGEGAGISRVSAILPFTRVASLALACVSINRGTTSYWSTGKSP